MEITSYEEIWRRIPPEEKLDIMAQANGKGVLGALTLIVIGGTVAVGLQHLWIFWTAIALSPIIFQAVVGRAWKSLRPVVVLEYLAARTAARRYAYVVKSEDLHVELVFRGILEEPNDSDTDELYASSKGNNTTPVWVALFGDAVVMMSERRGGAEMKFGHLINDKLGVTSNADEIGGDYSVEKEIRLQYEDKFLGNRQVKLTSRYPAALVVFEKKVHEVLQANAMSASILGEMALDGLENPDAGELSLPRG